MTDTHHAVPTQQVPKQKKQLSRSISNILTIIGFIILLIIIVWGLFHLATLSSPWLSSLFTSSNTSQKSIAVSAPSSVTSGSPTTVSWKYTPATKGTYAFMYECADGLKFGTPTGETVSTIPCGSAFTTSSASNSVMILPVNSGSSSASTTITILYIPSDGSAQAKGTAKVSVVPRSGTTKTPHTTTPDPIESTLSAPDTESPSVATGPADIAVRIVSITVDASGQATAIFDIANIGGSSTGTYYFTANLPTTQGYNFVSQAQAPLSPGSHIMNTLRFNQVVPGGGQFQITVMPLSGEATTVNNYASQYVPGPAYNQTYQTSGYQYDPYSY